MIYDKEYFIKKFEAIPEEKWTTKSFYTYGGRCCALGHCGKRMGLVDTDESYALGEITSCSTVAINDGLGDYIKYGNTPKERILNFLKQLK